MIVNVMDLRERPYRWAAVMAVAQAASKDNEAEDGDKVKAAGEVEIDYAERNAISVREAVLWAERLDGLVTLYLYDREEDGDA